MKKFKHELGAQATHSISGFSGTITGRIEYLHDGNRYEVTSERLHEGKTQKEWFSESEIESA